MPVGGGPPPNGAWPDPTVFTSASGQNGPLQFTQPTLAEIDRRLTVRQRRWEALKRLRVLRLSLDPALAATLVRRADLNLLFPEEYYDVYANPRLSKVFELAKVKSVARNLEHLDLDWFGANYENWWAPSGSVDGTAFHLAVAEQLQNLIENSFGLPNPPAGSADPQYWSWAPGVAYATWQEDLAFQEPPAALAPGPVMILEWEVSSAGPASPTVATVGNTMRMRSQMPSPPVNGIQLA